MSYGDLEVLLRSRVPLIVVESRDESRVLKLLQRACRRAPRMAAAPTGGAVGDFASEMLALSGLNEGLAIVGSIAEHATGAAKAWADEQATLLDGFVDDSLNAAGDAWDAVVEGGEEAAGAVGDIVEEAGSQLADVGDAAGDTWDQAVDFVTSLW